MKTHEIYPRLYAKRTGGGIHTWCMERQGNEVRSHSGVLNGALVTSEWKAIRGKNLGRSNALSPENAAHAHVLSAYKKRREIEGYCDLLEGVEAASTQYFRPMLARKYQDEWNRVGHHLKQGKPVFVQPKLDGMRCIATPAGLFSRQGKPILSAPHVHQDLLKVMEAYDHEWVFDGELYADKLNNDFNKIISLAKKTKPTIEDLRQSEILLEYHIYDMPICNSPIPDDDVPSFDVRSEEIDCTIGAGYGALKNVPTHAAKNLDEIGSLFQKHLLDGYEGAMIRLNGPYESGKRSPYLLKFKEFQEEEFTILGIEEGQGNRSGMAGFLSFKTAAGKPFTAACKGTTAFFRQLLAQRDTPATAIGKFATVKFQNWTPDGVPRFPCVKAIRDYE